MNSRKRLLRNFLLRPYIDLPNFVDHLTRKPYAYTTRCKCKITRFNLASRETGIKRFRAWTHRWVRPLPPELAEAADSGDKCLRKINEPWGLMSRVERGTPPPLLLMISIVIASGKLACGSENLHGNLFPFLRPVFLLAKQRIFGGGTKRFLNSNICRSHHGPSPF